MNRVLLCMVFFMAGVAANGQTDSLLAISEIQKFQKELNEDYLDRKKSPLEPKEFKRFKGHSFFPINLKFRVTATLSVTEGTPFFKMKTTLGLLLEYRKYADLIFTIGQQEFSLPIYQSKSLMTQEEYKDYLFFPFTDLTNGEASYGGGRYIGLRMPKQGNELVLDFNQAYNPYCAYSHQYSCPIVPAANNLPVLVEAGVQLFPRE